MDLPDGLFIDHNHQTPRLCLQPAGTLELHPVMQTPYLVHICFHRILRGFNLQPGDLFEILIPYELCLEHLAVVLVMFTPENHSERYFWHPFHDFPALKSLKVEEHSDW